MDVTPEDFGHLRTRLADYHDVLPSPQTDEIARFKDHFLSRNRLALDEQVVVSGQQKHSSDRGGGRLFDLMENTAARKKVSLPIQDLGPNAKQKPFD
jgi:hypothetical protein